jgi:POT family proton-dependent oligopeptide transporter
MPTQLLESIMFWLISYLFHTLGEDYVFPVGLSYVSKLVPIRNLDRNYVWGVLFIHRNGE